MQKETKVSNILLALTATAGLALLTFPTASVVRSFKLLLAYAVLPAPLALDEAADRLAAIPANVTNLLLVDQQNRRLSEEYKSLELLRSQVATLEGENERLRSLLGLETPQGYKPVWSRIIHRDPSQWYRMVVLDKGAEHGIELDQPVVARADVQASTEAPAGLGIVGRVVEVYPRSSKVLLVTDDLSSVAVALDTGWSALVEGIGSPYLRLNYLSERAELKTGQEVLTAALSPTFPPGLRVGQVVEIYPQDLYLNFQSARLDPTVHIGRLREVAVLVKDRKDAKPARAPELAATPKRPAPAPAVEAAP